MLGSCFNYLGIVWDNVEIVFAMIMGFSLNPSPPFGVGFLDFKLRSTHAPPPPPPHNANRMQEREERDEQ